MNEPVGDEVIESLLAKVWFHEAEELKNDAQRLLAIWAGKEPNEMEQITPGAFGTIHRDSPETIAQREADRAAYEVLPEIEKAKLEYANGEGYVIYDMIESYRKSITNGAPRPKDWHPRDDHLLAMWTAYTS